MREVAEIAEALRAYRFRYSDEDALQAAIGDVLRERRFAPIHREFILDRGSRIDFLVGRVGIEVKVAGRTAGVERQLRRYAASVLVGGLVLVTNRARHVQLPAQINGKPVEVVSLMGAGL